MPPRLLDDSGPVPMRSGAPLSTRTMSFRQLIVWLDAWARQHEDGELDMPVVLRISDEHEGEIMGGLIGIDVDDGCTASDALVLDGSTATEDA